MDEQSRLERIARNERVLRDANKRIETVATKLAGEGFASERPIEFFCACGRPECDAQVELTVAEYRAVRTKPNHFVVAPGHETPDLERVVERHERYLVVEKLAGRGPQDDGIAELQDS